MIVTQTLRTPRPTLYQKFRRIYAKQVDGLGLAVFRIVFCSVLLAEVLHLFYFRHLIFDVIPFVEVAEIGFTTPLLLWMATLLLLIFGLYTRPAALVNYGFALVFFASLKTYSYMMTPVYIGMSFLFLFLPISRRLSLDRLRLKLRYSNTQFRYHPPATVSQLAYYVPVVVGIAFVYLDSTLYKLTSPMWLAGLGMWKTLSLPYETQLNSSFILNNELLVKALGYLTLVFEFFFLFLFPFRKYRLVLMLIGIGLHLGILIFFAFPLFAIGFGSIYLLVVPVGMWRRLFAPSAGSPALAFFYDAECPLCARTRLVIEHFDTRRAVLFRTVQFDAAEEPALAGIAPQALLADVYSVDAKGRVFHGVDTYIQVFRAIPFLKPFSWLLRLPGVYHLSKAAYRFIARNRTTERCTEESCGYTVPAVPAPDEAVKVLQTLTLRDIKLAGAAFGLAGLALLQCLVSYHTPLIELLRRKSGLERTFVGRGLARVSGAVEGPARNFFGISNHPIALDEHFAGYTRLVAITYAGADGVERFLPLTRPSGQPGAYLYGALWLKWTYGVVSGRLEQQRVEKGIRNFTAFWANKNHVDLNDCRFKVKVKKIAEATTWQPDFLNQQINAAWQDAGEVTWHNQQFATHLRDLKTL
jgi:predicted DCC family thiol-disulfide oxidoreductase YuxK